MTVASEEANVTTIPYMGSPKRGSSSLDHLNHMLTDSILNTHHRVPHKRSTARALGDSSQRDDTDVTVETLNDDDKTLSCSALPLPYDRFRKYFVDCKKEWYQKSKYVWLATFTPAFVWLLTYDWRVDLFADVMAGLTVGIMIIPQSMSYAKLAGLPVEYGLYSSLVPVYAYALFGSSRQLAIGPVALLSLMLSAGLGRIVDPDGGKNTQLYFSIVILPQVLFNSKSCFVLI